MVGQQVARRRRRDDAEVAVRGERGDAPAQRPLQVALLDEEGFEHVLDGFGVLADGVRKVVEADRAAENFSITASSSLRSMRSSPARRHRAS